MTSPASTHSDDADSSLPDRLYDRLVATDGRVCADIDEQACQHVPGNFIRLVGANTLTKMGDELANPKTTLAWLLNAVHAPVFLIGLLVPIRESGSMLPQVFLASRLQRLARRKWPWVVGSLVQGAAVAAMGAVVYFTEGPAAGVLLIALLALFSLGRALCSIAHKDVLGKTIPKTRRGRVSGIAASLSGAFALMIGLYLLWRGDTGGQAFYITLLLLAGGLWGIAAGLFSRIREVSSTTDEATSTHGSRDDDEPATESGLAYGVSLLKSDTAFREFVIVRALLLSSALTAPYYIVLATGGGEAGVAMLGSFILANGLAATLSSPFWGRLADVSSRRVLMRAAVFTGALGLSVAVLGMLVESGTTLSRVLFPFAFFLLGIAHSGVRLGRKTYVIDLASGDQRTGYVAVSNSLIGVILLATGLVGALASLLSPIVVIVLLSLMTLYGAYRARNLREVQQ